MSKFTQQHYETVAGIVYETEKEFGTWQSRSAIDSIFSMLRKKFVAEFRWDNESFKEDLFRRASTFKPSHREGCRNSGQENAAGHVCNSGRSDAEISASTAVANVNKFEALRHD